MPDKEPLHRSHVAMEEHQDRAVQEGGAEVLQSPSLLGRYFRDLFGTEEWGKAPSPPAYRSGPVPKSSGSLAQQRLADPEARFWFSAMMAEAMLLPICIAHNTAEKAVLNTEIAAILGLDTALEKGWIRAYVIGWRAGRFPTVPTGIRIGAAEGRRTRSQVLGSLEPHIRKFVDRAKDPVGNLVHLGSGGKRIG